MSTDPRSPESLLDPDYFASRAATERRLAEEASDERARLAHQQLAAEYDRKARTGIAND